MKLLVTGGAGFMGTNLVRYLLGDASQEMGSSVEKLVNLDKLTYAGNLSNLASVEGDDRYAFVHGDIADEALVGQLLRDYKIDAVMHLAAESHVDRSIDGPEVFIATNVLGTGKLLETCRRYHDECRALKKFLHVSTDEVFGSLEFGDPPFDENSLYRPNSPYSASKAGGDHIVRAYHHTFGLPVVTVHCSNNYGPYQFPEKLIPLMISKTLRGESLPVYGDGQNVRDWLHVGDACRGMWMSLLGGASGATYCIGGKCEVRNIDLVKMIVDAVRELAPDRGIRPAEELISYVADRPGHDRRYAINPARISQDLGWSPRQDFERGLRETVAWYLEHPDWIREVEGRSYKGQRLGSL